MEKIVIIIPSRLNAERLPNKPLKLINNKEMILHVHDVAKSSNIGEVIVATPDQEILDLIRTHNGQAILTSDKHETGTDRVYEVFENTLKSKPEIIINFQGDMPNLNPDAIKNLAAHMKKNLCDIATLASSIENNIEENDPNVVKVITDHEIKNKIFSKALDFFRSSDKTLNKQTYHHVGIYAFTNKALIRYVSLKRSKLEIERKLEQMRALENQMKIDVGYIDTCPLSVDTETDLKAVKKIMENK
jgi:3-deoxy-manno-octulosonate cytidylyltransferase (CMP-KDO synthetase)|tara:strand:- start:907 stop:1644 length:738 start_codon:yes stop_codon:yes gene_type:complete